MLNQKGISPVVAVSLLLVVSVTAVVGFQNWFTTFQSEVTLDVETQSSQGVSTSGVENIIGNILYFNNKQNSNLTVNSIQVGGIDCQISENLTKGINKIDISSCLENISDATPEIVVTTNKNIFTKQVFIDSKQLSQSNSGSGPCLTTGTNGFAGGDGSLGSPYQVCNCFQLQNMSNHLSSNFELISNVDCSMSSTWNSGNGFIPVGNVGTSYSGTFNGNDFQIQNLYINNSNQFTGLFGAVGDATISNLQLSNSNVISSSSNSVGSITGFVDTSIQLDSVYVIGNILGDTWGTGGLIGDTGEGGNLITVQSSRFNGIINGQSNTGGLLGGGYSSADYLISNSNVSASITGINSVGGIIGFSYEFNISNSHFTGSIQSTGSGVGGLVGQFGIIDNSEIIDSTVTNSVINSSSNKVGGLIGDTQNSQELYIKKSSVTNSNISGDEYVGGLIGSTNNIHLSNSYSIVDIYGNEHVGGLAGYSGGMDIENSYSVSQIYNQTSNAVGGLFGFGGMTVTTESYWDADVSGLADNDGGFYGNAYTTAQMQTASTYSTWNTSIWNIIDGSYPTLR